MKQIKDLLSRVMLFCRLECSIVAQLEEMETRIYALEQNRKMKDEEIKRLKKELQDLSLVVRKQVPVCAEKSV